MTVRRDQVVRPFAWSFPTGLLILILIAGMGLRFYTLGLLRHGTDEAFPMYQALQMLDGGIPALQGQPSSVFLDNPVLMTYIQVVPLLFWRSLWGPYLLITALNGIAVAFVYRAGRETFGEAVGLIAVFLFATNPWVVFFSRPTWVQGLIPLFTSVIAWGLLPSIEKKSARPYAVTVGLLALTAVTQTYIQAWGMLAQIGPILALFWRRFPRRALLTGIVVFGVASAVYAAQIPGRWQAYMDRLNALSQSTQPEFSLSGLNHAVRFVTGLDSEYIRIWYDLDPLDWRHIATLAAHYVLSLALIAGIVRAIRALIVQHQWRIAAALLIWFSLPIALTLISATEIHPHYLMISLPAGHLLAAWGIEWPMNLSGKVWRIARPAIGGILVAIGGVFALNVHFTGQYVATQQMLPDFNGWPLANDARLGAAIRELAHGTIYPLRVAATGQSANLSSIAGTYIETLPEVDYPSWVILPGSQPILYVLANRQPQPGALGPHQEDFPAMTLSPALGVTVTFQRVQPYTRKQALALPATPLEIPTEAGLTLLGYSLRGAAPGQTATITTYWRVETLVSGRDQWFAAVYYHLNAADHPQVVNLTGHGQYGARWVDGDIYVERMDIVVPSAVRMDGLTLEIGLFDPIHARNFLFITPQGNQAGIVIQMPAP